MTALPDIPDQYGLRQAVVDEAFLWIGTPYRHQASFREVGADCLGLVRGVWRTIYGSEPEAPPPYTPDWAEASGAEPLLSAARRHLTEIDVKTARAGDVILFRMKRRGPAKHLGILIESDEENPRFVHAFCGRGVCESSLSEIWRGRLAYAFAFPT